MEQRPAFRSNQLSRVQKWGRRAHFRAMGLSEEELDRPKIAVVNSSSELAICFRHLDAVAERVKQAVREAGGVPFEIRTTAPSDFITNAGKAGGYVLPTRDLIMSDIEAVVEGALLDGMILLSSCDKTAPAHLMAAASLNLPSILVIGGYQPSGKLNGETVDLEDLFIASCGEGISGCDDAQLVAMSEVAVQGPGVCPGMGTANSMHIVSEVLGMTIPGSAPVLANSERMWKNAEAAGRRIVELVYQDRRPRDILTPSAFRNAVKVSLAVGASINVVKHLQAVAVMAEVDVDIPRLFEEYAPRIPLLCAVRPNGDHRIEDLERAGGARAVMKRLESVLELDAVTVTDQTWRELLADVTVGDEDVVRPLDRPWRDFGTILLVRGSLAPEGAIMRLGADENRPMEFEGPARTFQSQADALEAVRRGEIREGDVVVLRGVGPIGRPGMAMVSTLAFALEAAGLTNKVAMVTDGQVSGLLNKGLVLAEVAPEAGRGGPLAQVRDGDRIRIDLRARRADLLVDEKELQARGDAPIRSVPEERGWLDVYSRVVQPMTRGGVITGKESPPYSGALGEER